MKNSLSLHAGLIRPALPCVFTLLITSLNAQSQNPYLGNPHTDSLGYKTLENNADKYNVLLTAGLYMYGVGTTSVGLGLEVGPVIRIGKMLTLSAQYRPIAGTIGKDYKDEFYRNKYYQIFEATANFHLSDKIESKAGNLAFKQEGSTVYSLKDVPVDVRIIKSIRLGTEYLDIPLTFTTYGEDFEEVYGCISYFTYFIGYDLSIMRNAVYQVEYYGEQYTTNQFSVFADLMMAPGNLAEQVSWSDLNTHQTVNYHNFGTRIGLKAMHLRYKFGASFEMGYFPGIGGAEPLNDVYIAFSIDFILGTTLNFLMPKR
jgi:hypothetical protein